MASATVSVRPGRLLELAVSDLALIDRLRLPLEGGFNVLTGETGAGKSLLIDALGLATGARADTTLVRHGAQSARVEALFDRFPEPLIAVREISVTGRSTARLDDESVTAGRLGQATSGVVEIHGQHDQQRLLDEDWQRDLLDAFGGHGEQRAAVAAAVDRWRANRSALAELTMDPRELLRRLEILEHETAEIEGGRLRPGEADEITAQLAAAQHGETIASGAATVRETLLAEGSGARERVAHAERELRSLARLDPRWGPLADRLAGLEAEVEDVAAEVRAVAETVDHDPASLAALEQRLGEIHRLLRRYGDDEAVVIAHGVRAAPRRRGSGASRPSGRAAPTRTPGCSWPSPTRRRRSRSCATRRPGSWAEPSPRCWRSWASRPTPSPSRWAAGPRPATIPPSRSTATPSPSTRPASTPSCSPSVRTPASRPGRSPGSRPAASCRASPSP